ncbi:hypothetical protein Acr_01g0001110 [Actinidia rufa]|uniref:Uncharacterized protein n=1 Tax=Actinidia rufa TaxID=165716 RepID=A0A7J0E1Z8_9ERIC|nr:hypothetical protein Acr_01g0001110 [Actinidia rufa]
MAAMDPDPGVAPPYNPPILLNNLRLRARSLRQRRRGFTFFRRRQYKPITRRQGL